MGAEDITEQDVGDIKQGVKQIKQKLRDYGWTEEDYPEIPEKKTVEGEVYVKANPILGVEKYLGNTDKRNRLAYFPQIKMTHDSTVAKTYLKFSEEFDKDHVIVGGEEVDKGEIKGLEVMVEQLREWTGLETNFVLVSDNFEKVETDAKGIGMSASAAGAIAKAFGELVFPELTDNARFMSSFARLFSGSGTSSVPGGVSLWISYPGIDPKESYGVRIDQEELDLRLVVVPITSNIKTEDAHGAATSSELYRYWATHKTDKCLEVIEAVNNNDIETIGKRAELDSLNLFHLLVSGGSYFNWMPDTLDILTKVNMLRKKKGLTAYCTMDTGPSVGIITTKEEAPEVKEEMEDYLEEKGHEHPVYYADLAGGPETLPLENKDEVLTSEIKGLLKEKGINL